MSIVHITPAPNQELHYIAVKDGRVVAEFYTNTNKTDFPARDAKEALKAFLDDGAELFMWVARSKSQRAIQ